MSTLLSRDSRSPVAQTKPRAAFSDRSRALLAAKNPIDVFAAVNVILFLGMATLRYYPRFLQYRGPGNLPEFFLYAVFILLGILLLWQRFRSVVVPPWLLFALQAGIVLHFAGGLLFFGERRLYDLSLFGSGLEALRFDKLVHLVNAAVVALLILRLVCLRTTLDSLARLFVILCVLGLGALVEIVEYGAYLMVKNAGVGTYTNNMLDLVANLAGASLSTWLFSRRLAATLKPE